MTVTTPHRIPNAVDFHRSGSPAVVHTDRFRAGATRVDDVVIKRLRNELPETDGGANLDRHDEGEVMLHVVRRGGFGIVGRDNTIARIPPGRFLLQCNSPASRFETAPHTVLDAISMPDTHIRRYFGNRDIAGSSDTAEMRLLMAHTRMIEATVDDLTPVAEQAARAALVELLKGVIAHGVEGDEPLLTPALTRAAADLVDDLLIHPDLSPAVLARKLGVSVRTLQRAFAVTGESVTDHIRRRRVEGARRQLAARDNLLSVSEIASRWQFADSSHFTRVFKSHYDQTPTQFVRSIRRPPAERTPHSDSDTDRKPAAAPPPSVTWDRYCELFASVLSYR